MCIYVYAQCIWWYLCPLGLLDKEAHTLLGPADVLPCGVEPGVKTHNMRGGRMVCQKKKQISQQLHEVWMFLPFCLVQTWMM